MSGRPLSVDPPDLGTVATARRMAALWREQGRLVVVGLVCALVYTGLSLAIPIVVRHAIDSSIAPTNGHHDPLWPYLVAIIALAVVRFFINFTRRYATSRTGIRVEWRMRELLYQAYLRYPRAFYDRHATGQVVSRATNDLYPIRYFIGWGMTQGLQSLMMILGIAVTLFVVNPKLAAIALVSMPLVGILAFMFARRVMPISRHVQQLKADVTEAADEAVVGIEMVQAFGREDDVHARFTTKAEAVRDGVLRQARVEATFLPGLLFLPTLSIGAVVLFGGRDVIGGTLTYGEFFLFYQLLLQMVWPLEALGWILSLAQRATASASRSFAWLRGIEPIPEPAEPRSLPAGPLGITFEGVHFEYGVGSEVLSGIDLELQPGEIVAICGPTGAGKSSLLNLVP
ncbi:MAG TPA: ABC transporter ATP-binding protein, partial [Gaiellaceae bacterium]